MPDLDHSDEFDLLEYLSVIIKRKRTILAVFFLTVTVAAITIFSRPRVYEAASIVRIGSINQPLLSKKEALYEVGKFNNPDKIYKMLKLDKDSLKLEGTILAEDIEATDLIKIKVKIHNPDFAMLICNILTNNFVAEQNNFYDKRVEFLREEINSLELEASRATVNRPLRGKARVKAPTEIDKNRIFSLKKELVSSKNFEVVEPAAVSSEPFFRDALSPLVTAAVSALMAGLLIVSFQEFPKKREKD